MQFSLVVGTCRATCMEMFLLLLFPDWTNSY